MTIGTKPIPVPPPEEEAIVGGLFSAETSDQDLKDWRKHDAACRSMAQAILADEDIFVEIAAPKCIDEKSRRVNFETPALHFHGVTYIPSEPASGTCLVDITTINPDKLRRITANLEYADIKVVVYPQAPDIIIRELMAAYPFVNIVESSQLVSFCKERELTPCLKLIIDIICDAFEDIDKIEVEFTPDPEIPNWDTICFRVSLSAPAQNALECYESYVDTFYKTIAHDKQRFFTLVFEITE